MATALSTSSLLKQVHTQGELAHRYVHCLHRPHAVAHEFIQFCKRLGMRISPLRGQGNHPSILFATHQEANNKARLVMAGTHGDEPAGVLGMLQFLNERILKNDLAEFPPFAFIPMVSPTAYGLATRKNAWNENANRGYHTQKIRCHEACETPSREGRTLLENAQKLLKFSQAGALSMHEDVDAHEFYLYAYENTNNPTMLVHQLNDIGASYFGKIADSDCFENAAIRDGIIFNDFGAGAFDECLHIAGTPTVIVTETPAKQALDDRIHLNTKLIETFLRNTQNKQ